MHWDIYSVCCGISAQTVHYVTENDDKIVPGTNTATQNYQATNNQNENLAAKENRKRNNLQANRGLNEPWEWYDKCNTRERNMGMLTIVILSHFSVILKY